MEGYAQRVYIVKLLNLNINNMQISLTAATLLSLSQLHELQ